MTHVRREENLVSGLPRDDDLTVGQGPVDQLALDDGAIHARLEAFALSM